MAGSDRVTTCSLDSKFLVQENTLDQTLPFNIPDILRLAISETTFISFFFNICNPPF